jgi:hypothetical protein
MVMTHRNSSWIATLRLTYATKHMDDEQGIYNTLVALTDLSRSITDPRKDEINTFCDRAEMLSQRAKQQSDELRKWLKTPYP